MPKNYAVLHVKVLSFWRGRDLHILLFNSNSYGICNMQSAHSLHRFSFTPINEDWTSNLLAQDQGENNIYTFLALWRSLAWLDNHLEPDTQTIPVSHLHLIFGRVWNTYGGISVQWRWFFTHLTHFQPQHLKFSVSSVPVTVSTRWNSWNIVYTFLIDHVLWRGHYVCPLTFGVTVISLKADHFQ